VRTQRCRESDHRIDPREGKQESAQRKASDEAGIESPWRFHIRDRFIHRLYLLQCEERINLRNG
jgi:hypothetical protein